MKKYAIAIIIIFVAAVFYFSKSGDTTNSPGSGVIQNQSGQSESCSACNGTRICNMCNGSGTYTANGLTITDPNCNGSGVCPKCGGYASFSAGGQSDYNTESVDNDNYNIQPVRNICISCHGSGTCPLCHGTGTYRNYGQSSPCERYCTICGGTGYTQ
jgi:hypothetical protein